MAEYCTLYDLVKVLGVKLGPFEPTLGYFR